MIEQKHMHPTVELCRKCSGQGIVTHYPQWDRLHQHPTDETCKLCQGSGRVLVSKMIEITVLPFKTK